MLESSVNVEELQQESEYNASFELDPEKVQVSYFLIGT